MITETPYNQPHEVGYQSFILDDDKPIAFRKLDGGLVYLFANGLTSADVLDAAKAALHDLETSEGLVKDGGEAFELKHASLPQIKQIVDSLDAMV